jgi:hypothetical protein
MRRSQMSRIGLKSQLSLSTVPSIHFSFLHDAALSCRHHHLESGRVCSPAAPSRPEDRLFSTLFTLLQLPALPSTCLFATETIVHAPLETRRFVGATHLPNHMFQLPLLCTAPRLPYTIRLIVLLSNLNGGRAADVPEQQ